MRFAKNKGRNTAGVAFFSPDYTHNDADRATDPINASRGQVSAGVATQEKRKQVHTSATIHPITARYSQRNTFPESAVQITNTRTSATMSPVCADHASPFKTPWSSDTA
jgi:hypothetical protein